MIRTPEVVAKAVIARMGTKMVNGASLDASLLPISIVEEVSVYRVEIAKAVADQIKKSKSLSAKARKTLATELDAVFGGG